MNLQERNRLRNRAHIAQAALELFLRDGFDETTVDAVAQAAGVSRRTFFRYFETKEAAFFANQEERLGLFKVMMGGLQNVPRGYPRLRAACLEMSTQLMAQRELALAQHRVTVSSKNLMAYDLQLDQSWEQVMFEELVADSRDDGSHQMHAQVWAGAVVGLVRVVLRRWFQADAQGDLRAIGEQAFALLERGPLRPPH